MRKCYGGVIVASFLMLLVFGYYVIKNPINESYFTSPVTFNGTNPLEWLSSGAPPALQNPGHTSQVISTEDIVAELFARRNLSKEELRSLQTWNLLKVLVTRDQGLPNAVEAVKEAVTAWKNLITSVEEEKIQSNNGSSQKRGKEKQCPHFLSKMNASEHDDNGFKLWIPCGLTQGSSITFIGIPNGLLGNFRVDLTGEPLPGEPEPPIILHYNVRLHGDKITEDPVIVQNTWTIAHDWGEEERCPSPEPEKIKKVDDLDQCNELVGRETNQTVKASRLANGTSKISMVHDGKTTKYFPFRQHDLFVATLRIGAEGIQMTVDGKHITSFAFRETLEPWLVSEVRISGDINLISVVTSGLPTSEDLDHTIDLDSLKAVPIPPRRYLDLFVGIFSTANNFKRRMAVRRSWMQYPEVRLAKVAVRFFVGLHKNQRVNEELWNEARTYGDIQLMPFVDYYSLISWKTIAICIFGTEVVSAKYIMKTDDDAFVRIDEILNSVKSTNTARGLLYGLINTDSKPHRNPDSKWFISPEEWPDDTYPPWAHGPGYVVSNDIARTVSKKHRKGRLKIFKLEDVAMGIWIADMQKKGLQVRYEKDERIINDGCKDGYVVAHYQGPRELLCLWQKIQEKKRANCCGE
ncbi:beta-1,3-galactosyltransferase GALT1-like [Andrographis paniculata]|uniref:beta-1,3-galactosyltransferase GALT1-like n=1 Tax=Andrographis paniculata TaxID=175694 RepID=UPI0021E7DC87|nr:beta-1,3-galactosyltransferase GALT1-like [Andrographis paniculata]